jgi:hypothetical protein
MDRIRQMTQNSVPLNKNPLAYESAFLYGCREVGPQDVLIQIVRFTECRRTRFESFATISFLFLAQRAGFHTSGT